jgi:xanthine/CO dehydrogenase XdhC/CoxF family maturation factor
VLDRARRAMNAGRTLQCEVDLTGGAAAGAGPADLFRAGEARRARALFRYVEPVTPLLIFGAGDDARPLVAQAKLLGWHVTVLDRRARLATAARFPLADAALAGPWEDALARAAPRADAAAVVMTHSFADDAEILSLLARRVPAYVGLLGPPARRDAVLAEARALAGELPAALFERLRAPVGLDLGVKSPEAVALSIAAEIVAETAGRDAMPLSRRRGTFRAAGAGLPAAAPGAGGRVVPLEPCPTRSRPSSPPPAHRAASAAPSS